ncbi:MAG: CDP-alcohol phosphatidyltransferase family protein, partial [Candidatus Babeliales bacterium]
LFVTAAVTDVLDGNIARWRNEQTFLGACLDPIADKCLLVSCFFTLAFVRTPLFSIPRWFVIIMLIKEVIIVGGAYAIYLIRGSVAIEPTRLGKMTTVFQVLFIIWLFACYFFQWVPIKTYYVMLTSVLIIAGASCAHYVAIGVQQVMKGR